MYRHPEKKQNLLNRVYSSFNIECNQEDGNDDPVCKTGKKTQMCIPDFWTQRERERVG